MPSAAPRHLARCAAVVTAIGGAIALCGGAGAQGGKLDARYTVTLAGIPIGKGAWVIDVGDDQYTAAASGMTTGLLRVFASGQGNGASRGHVTNGGNLIASTYASSITSNKATEELRISLVNGTVKDYVVEPPTPPNPDRIPVTDAHKKGVTDPMTAALVKVAGATDPVSPEACHGHTSIFDGRMRYDLSLSFKRIDTVRADKGYQGPVAVCAVYFKPVAGYIPDRPAIKYLIAQRDMEIWFAPLLGTRLVVPFRISIPTPLGLGVLQATQFNTFSQPVRATPTSAHVD